VENRLDAQDAATPLGNTPRSYKRVAVDLPVSVPTKV
jgi:hypothetical protein